MIKWINFGIFQIFSSIGEPKFLELEAVALSLF